MNSILLFVTLSLLSQLTFANERVLPRQLLLAQGYQPAFTPPKRKVRDQQFPSHTLPWPVKFADAHQTVAQNYVNFQSYGGPAYFHGGCDLISTDHGNVKATVSGKIVAGYYSYSQNVDGSMEKLWKPLEGTPHADPYFEIAIITNSGYRFEFHHIDATQIPVNILGLIQQGGEVTAGALLGYIYGAPFPGYAHVHYNVISPEGVRINPEFVSQILADQTPPVLHASFAVYNNRVIRFVEGQQINAQGLIKFVLVTTESHDQDAYVQTPPFVGIKFKNSQQSYGWDFRKTLLGPNGLWPDLRLVFTPRITFGQSTYETQGQFGKGLFLMNIFVDPKERGPFEIAVMDGNGNKMLTAGQLL